MYSEQDLQSAVAAGAISAEAAHALRAHVGGASHVPAVDEEHFRLVTGFNDIFVAIASVILLVAVGWIGESLHPALAGVLVAAAAWGLAEFFTRKRRMALPSILLLLAFSGGVFATLAALLVEDGEALFGTDPGETVTALLGAAIFVVTGAATWLHWRRFMVPITVAVGTAAAAGTVITLILAAIGETQNVEAILMPLLLAAGVVVFGFAMHWDISDRERQTRRSDVAFWLHLLAAPMIVHPLFWLVGVTEGDNIGAVAAIAVLAIYVGLGAVALAVDRRALLVSALAYVLFALTFLFQQFGVVELGVAFTALVIGSTLLTLSAFWTPIRTFIVHRLPGELQARLPVLAMA